MEERRGEEERREGTSDLQLVRAAPIPTGGVVVWYTHTNTHTHANRYTHIKKINAGCFGPT